MAKRCMTEAQFRKWMKGKKMVTPDAMASGFERVPSTGWKKRAREGFEEPEETPMVIPKNIKTPGSHMVKGYEDAVDRMYKHASSVVYDKKKKRFCVSK